MIICFKTQPSIKKTTFSYNFVLYLGILDLSIGNKLTFAS